MKQQLPTSLRINLVLRTPPHKLQKTTHQPEISDFHSTMMTSIPHQDQRIAASEAVIGYSFTNKALPWQALQAPGSDVQVIDGRRVLEGNKTLALVGDAVITLLLKSLAYTNAETIGTIAEPCS